MRVPTLLLIGRREVVWNPVTALRRARQLFPDIQAELVPNSSHEMCFSQCEFVDARVRQFLNTPSARKGGPRVLVSASTVDACVGRVAV
jgi:pimeloyl-ACP methyl ester carboxylesterase